MLNRGSVAVVGLPGAHWGVGAIAAMRAIAELRQVHGWVAPGGHLPAALGLTVHEAKDPWRAAIEQGAVALFAAAAAPIGLHRPMFRLLPASMLSGAVLIDHGLALRSEGLAAACQLAGSAVAWDDGTHDPRLRLYGPPPAAWLHHPVVLVDSRGLLRMPLSARQLAWQQLRHAWPTAVLLSVGPVVPGIAAHVSGEEAWIAAGRAVAVIAHPGPLGWDANRLGIPVHAPPWPDEDPPPAQAEALMLPAVMGRDPEVWRKYLPYLLRAHRQRTAVVAAMHPAVMRAWRRLQDLAVREEPAVWRKRLSKLASNPSGFWRDSRINPANWLTGSRGAR